MKHRIIITFSYNLLLIFPVIHGSADIQIKYLYTAFEVQQFPMLLVKQQETQHSTTLELLQQSHKEGHSNFKESVKLQSSIWIINGWLLKSYCYKSGQSSTALYGQNPTVQSAPAQNSCITQM